MDALELARRMRDAALAKKATNVLIFDVRGRSTITDFIVLASASSPPQLKAIEGEVQRTLREHDVRCYRCSGRPDDLWIALDYVDVVMHILTADLRDYYALEELWATVPRLD